MMPRSPISTLGCAERPQVVDADSMPVLRSGSRSATFIAATGGGQACCPGMTGEGWYGPLGDFPALEPGKAMACLKIGGSYQLP